MSNLFRHCLTPCQRSQSSKNNPCLSILNGLELYYDSSKKNLHNKLCIFSLLHLYPCPTYTVYGTEADFEFGGMLRLQVGKIKSLTCLLMTIPLMTNFSEPK